MVITALALFSGCVEKPIDKVISDKTEEISQGEQKVDDAGMLELDKWVEDNTAGAPEDPNDASQVIIDGWTHPMSLNPQDYITPDGDCSVLKKSTKYLGWKYFLEVGEVNGDIVGKDCYMCIGVMSDGERYRYLVVWDSAFERKTNKKMGDFCSVEPGELDNIKGAGDFEWKNIEDTEEERRKYGSFRKLYPDSNLYFIQPNIHSSSEGRLMGSPDGSIITGVRKVA